MAASQKEKVIAIIVIYHADEERLRQNVNSIAPQTDGIIFVVNGTDSAAVVEPYRQRADVDVIVNEDNEGIARALNQGLSLAEEKGYKWALTLDQDSFSTENMVDILMSHAEEENVGIIAPYASDRNFEKKKETASGIGHVKMAITSGSLHRIAAWKEAGGYNEVLFIDCVDNEFDARLIRRGYVILKDENAVLIHEIGRSEKIRFLGRPYVLRNYAPFRYYYFFRNLRFFYIMYPEFGRGGTRAESKRYELFVRFWMTILFEDQKKEKAAAMLRGLYDSGKLIRDERAGNKQKKTGQREYSEKDR